MTNTQVLSDDYQRSGTDLEELRTVLKEMDAMTSLKTTSTLDIELLSYDKSRGIVDGQTPFRVFHPYEGERASVGMSLDGPGKEKIAPLVRETRTNRLLLRVGSKVYFTAAGLMYTMSKRAGIGGANIGRPSGRRDAYIAELFGVDEKDVRMLVRKTGGARKVYAMHSDRYTRAPQTTLIDIIEKIEHGLGKPVCRNWDVTHIRSYVQLDFPERAKDFARVYGISDHIVPGLRLVTSDVGESSVYAVGTWRIGKGIAYCDEYSRKHVGKFDPEYILKQIDKQIFAKFESIPKTLAELSLINIKDPAGALFSVLQQIKLEAEVGKRRLQEITNLLSAQFNPALKYTAYDIAKNIMALPACLRGLPPTVLKAVESIVINAVFADYKEYETELVLGVA